MRPQGEVSAAILAAATRLVTRAGDQVRGPTVRELAAAACVGQQDAVNTVKNLTRCGKLRPVAERRVDYRNRPVAEYAPWSATAVTSPDGFTTLLTAWARG